jgi:hypothetical protein
MISSIAFEKIVIDLLFHRHCVPLLPPADQRNRRSGEGRARNDLERCKLERTNDIRKDSVNRSRSTLKGRISEQMASL